VSIGGSAAILSHQLDRFSQHQNLGGWDGLQELQDRIINGQLEA
jgi:hypothetical protein